MTQQAAGCPALAQMDFLNIVRKSRRTIDGSPTINSAMLNMKIEFLNQTGDLRHPSG